jgi:hypothetical protein
LIWIKLSQLVFRHRFPSLESESGGSSRWWVSVPIYRVRIQSSRYRSASDTGFERADDNDA